MPTIGSITKTIRISPGDLEIIKGLMEDGTSWSGAIHKLCQNVKSDVCEPKSAHEASPVLKEIEEMVLLCGCTLENFFEDVNTGLNEGTLVIDGGKLVLPEVNLDEFIRICHDKCLDPQIVLDKAAEALERGGI